MTPSLVCQLSRLCLATNKVSLQRQSGYNAAVESRRDGAVESRRDGKAPGLKVASAWRFRKSEMDRWMLSGNGKGARNDRQ